MQKNAITSTRRADDFLMSEIIEVSQRVLLRRLEGEDFPSFYDPEEVTTEEFEEILIGAVLPNLMAKDISVEHYFCDKTALFVYRGYISKLGKKYYWSLSHHGKIYRADADRAIEILKLNMA